MTRDPYLIEWTPWHYVLFTGFSVLSLSTFFLYPLLPFFFLFPVAVFVLRPYMRGSLYFYAIIFLFLLISPNVPPHEKHFRAPIFIGPFLLQDIVLIAAIGHVVLHRFFLPREVVKSVSPRFGLERFFFLFLVSGFLSIAVGYINGNDSIYWLSDSRDWLYYLLFWVILDDSADLSDYFRHWRMYSFAALGFGVLSILDSALNYGFSRYNSGISFLLLGPTLFFGLCTIFKQSYLPKRLSGILFGILLLAILVSFTRGLYLGLIVSILVIIVISGNKDALRFLLSAAITLTVIYLVLSLAGFGLDFLVDKAVNRGMNVGNNIDVSSVERVLEIIGVIQEFPSHPFFGTGAGGTVYVYRFTDLTGKVGMTDWWFIHNNYFQVLHKQGGVGLIVMLLLWIGSFFHAFRRFRSSTSNDERVLLLLIASLIAGNMIISMTSPIMTYSNTNFINALLFATLIGLERIRNSFQQHT